MVGRGMTVITSLETEILLNNMAANCDLTIPVPEMGLVVECHTENIPICMHCTIVHTDSH